MLVGTVLEFCNVRFYVGARFCDLLIVTLAPHGILNLGIRPDVATRKSTLGSKYP